MGHHAVQRALQVPHIGGDLACQQLLYAGRHLNARDVRLGLENGEAQLIGRRMQVGHDAAREPRAQAVLDAREVIRRLVGRDDDLLAGVNQRIESVEELLLRVVLADQELQVIHHQHMDRAQLRLELHGVVAAQRRDEAVHEFLRRHIGDGEVRILLAERPGDGVHQMRLAQAHAAIKKQRVETGLGRALGHAAGAGMSEFIGLADNEAVEGEAWIERH